MSTLSVASDVKEEEKLGEGGGWLAVRAAVMRTAVCVLKQSECNVPTITHNRSHRHSLFLFFVFLHPSVT